MILGIGNDIIEVERVKKACEKQSFLRRCYTDSEIELFQAKPQSLAGNFAAKEAVAKALGTGFLKFSPCDIEVLREEGGRPFVKLHGNAAALAKDLQVNHIFVSISNLKGLASAMAVMEKSEEGGNL